jgi:pilus assembly protein Flp/PilA
MGVLRRLFDRDTSFTRLLSDDSGATAIEYGLIAALIAVAAIAAFQLVGTNLTSVFNNVASDL